MAATITFFNHKGGVGKTTLLYHLAWKFTQKGKKVLMVDADSQCNLSTLSLGEDGFAQHYQQNPNDNIKTGLAPAFESRPKLIEAVFCPTISENSRLFLLPGSFEITEYETQLSVAINFNTTFLTMANLPGSFYRLISECANRYKVDYVFIDLNPGLSAINQTLLFSSDYFILPCGVDYFSKQAIRSLAKVLPTWAIWSQKAKEHFKDSVYPLPSSHTKLIGYTVNNFTIKNKKPALAVQRMIDDLDEEIKTVLLPKLNSSGLLIATRTHEYLLATVKSFNTLQQISHRVSKPVFELSAQDTGNSGVIAETQDLSIDGVNELFDDFYEQVISIINENGN